MILPVYLAMTAEEFSHISPLPRQPAWMACHFSPYGTGLVGLPENVPTGTLLMVNDRIPMAGHDPEQILDQLLRYLEACKSPAVVLDLQQKDSREAANLTTHLCKKLPCPVVVTPWYGEALSCPLLLPPTPVYTPLEEHIAPWQGRQLWLELALEATAATITEAGCTFSPAPLPGQEERTWEADSLCCRYRHKVHEDHIAVTLWRDGEQLKKLLRKAQELGIQAAVGLYQELGTLFTHKNGPLV